MAHNGEFKALVRKRMEITGESYTQAMRQILEAAGTAVPSTGAEGGRPPRPALQRSVPRPWDPPQTEFPAIVPISTLPFDRSGQSAIAITGISAYSNGFEIFVTRLIQRAKADDAGTVIPNVTSLTTCCSRYPTIVGKK